MSVLEHDDKHERNNDRNTAKQNMLIEDGCRTGRGGIQCFCGRTGFRGCGFGVGSEAQIGIATTEFIKNAILEIFFTSAISCYMYPTAAVVITTVMRYIV
jgi:hypothetical protein